MKRKSWLRLSGSGDSHPSEIFRLEPGETFEYRGERFLQTTPPQDGPEIRFTLAETQYEEELDEGAERRLIVRAGTGPGARTSSTSSSSFSSDVGRLTLDLDDLVDVEVRRPSSDASRKALGITDRIVGDNALSKSLRVATLP